MSNLSFNVSIECTSDPREGVIHSRDDTVIELIKIRQCPDFPTFVKDFLARDDTFVSKNS